MRFLHCSDVHITQDYARLSLAQMGWRRALGLFQLRFGGRGSAFADAESTLEQITHDAHFHAADHLLVTGDLTAYATDTEFAAARAALGLSAASRAHCSVIPGNHDAFTPNAVHSGRFDHHFGYLLESDFPEYCREGPYPFVHLKGNDAAVVGLNSARIMPMPGLAYGRVGAAQLDGLRAALADPRLQDRAVLVMVHHAPLTASGKPDSRAHGLVDAHDLLALLPGPRFGLLHGHIHHRYHHQATATTPHIFCAGASTQRGREGYWLIDVANGTIAASAMHVPQFLPTR